jgi:hypothetical protein
MSSRVSDFWQTQEMEMWRVPSVREEILRKKITHRRITYLFQWNRTNHRLFASDPSLHGFAGSLWDFLERVYRDDIPHQFFSRSDFGRASTMRLRSMAKNSETNLAYQLAKEGLINLESSSGLLKLVKKVTRSSTSHGSVLSYLLNFDPNSVASEVPVYSEELKLTGHIDLLRLRPSSTVEVLDFKPGLRDASLLLAVPQVAAYGILLGRLIPSIRKNIECTLFNSQESISFNPDVLETLGGDMLSPVLQEKERVHQLHQSTLDSHF